MKGISLHIGLNFVDPVHYEGWDGELVACEPDAKDMMKLAKDRGFKSRIILREKATAKTVKEAITDAAKALASGDTFFLTYSGHGGQVADLNGDEGLLGDAHDRKDETWCLFDRQLVDDELAALYARFKKSVRILVLSDSCHSGSVTRNNPPRPKAGRVRLMPREQALKVYLKNKALYDAIQRGLTGAEEQEIKAAVLLISGCQDNQLSQDGDENGLFTGTLKAVWGARAFTGGYREFRDAIAAEMPEDQTPNYFPTGAPNPDFEKEEPFTIEAALRRGGARKTAARKKVMRSGRTARGGKPIDTVISALHDMGYNEPRDGGDARPDSDLTGFFRRVKIDDAAYNVPGHGRLAQFVSALSERHNIQITIKQLLRDDYPTPQDIADLA